MSTSLSRRSFLYISGLLAASSAFSQSRVLGANERVRIAIVGMGWMGGILLDQFAEVDKARIVALCEVDSARLAAAAKQAERLVGKVDLETDYRRLLERSDIDAVVLATPNHWHALQTVWACQAGKDVYVEKPCAHSIWEGRQMVRAARHYKRVVQVGLQRRSLDTLAELRDWLQEGHIGAITGIHAHWYNLKKRGPIGRRSTPLSPPSTLDYNLWLGPAADEPIYRDELHYDWHWKWNTGNGEIGNVGNHTIDIARYLLGDPKPAGEIVSFGTRCQWDDAGDTPNLQTVEFQLNEVPVLLGINNFPYSRHADVERYWRAAMSYKGIRIGQIVFCEGGYFAGHGQGKVYDNNGKVIRRFAGSESHRANFIDAVISRKRENLACEVEQGHQSCTLPLLGTIAHRTGQAKTPKAIASALEAHPMMTEAFARYERQAELLGLDLKSDPWVFSRGLQFDPETERLIGNSPATEAANALLKRADYRAPFTMPNSGFAAE